MPKRLVALVIALAIAGAPVALRACEVACASTTASMTAHRMSAHESRGSHEHAAAAGHSCHEPSAAALRVTPESAPCHHDHAATIPSVAAARDADADSSMAAVVSAVDQVAPDRKAPILQRHQPLPPDPSDTRLTLPLRI